MRILNITSGIAVLLTTIALAHLLQHHFINASSTDLRDPTFVMLFAAAVGVGILAVVGGFLLLKRSR
jgi:hypothetical protein